ncbi:hypothetical protein E1281_00740 [Actinomadura sp. KC345]|uniref:hypothetical protein n=1 Tax=Actinomadura sp. KC345 TaxID=2530371 RepID=UPI00104FA1FE|nr:hypothetical protein [Actinomadura sp. KC345]TDC58667.1 hypothetical protein E1281_00740 [Actinomadura sp. KC345]
MPFPSRTRTGTAITGTAITAAAALAATLLTSSAAAPANARERAAAPDGTIVVFVTEGAQVSWAGTELKEYPASAECRSLPPGAHVIANHGSERLLFFTDPFCLTPVPPPFSFIPPGHGAHVAPTGSFRVG